LRIASDNSFSSSSGPSFFERLFGGSSQPYPAPPSRRRLQPQQGQSYYQR
jgi:L,D-transpeptidase YcbB